MPPIKRLFSLITLLTWTAGQLIAEDKPENSPEIAVCSIPNTEGPCKEKWWGGSCDMCDCHPFYFSFEGNYAQFYDTPKFTYGSIISLADALEVPFWTASHDEPDGFYPVVSAGVMLPWSLTSCFYDCSSKLRLTASGSFFSDSLTSTSNFNLPLTQLLRFPAIDGSSTISSGGTPGVAVLKRNYDFIRGALDLREALCFDWCGWSIALEPFIRYEMSRFSHNYGFRTSFTGFGDLLNVQESLNTYYYDIGGGLGAMLCLPCHFSFYLEGKVLGSYAYSHLNGESFNNAAPPLGIREVRESHKLWSSKFAAKAGLYYHLCNIVFGIVGSYEYWNYFPGVENPNGYVAVEPPARISNDNLAFYSIGLSISTPFCW